MLKPPPLFPLANALNLCMCTDMEHTLHSAQILMIAKDPNSVTVLNKWLTPRACLQATTNQVKRHSIFSMIYLCLAGKANAQYLCFS